MGKYMDTCTLRTLVWRGGAMVWQRARWFGVGGCVDICIAVKTYLLARVLVWCGARSYSAARAVVRRGARAGNLHGA